MWQKAITQGTDVSYLDYLYTLFINIFAVKGTKANVCLRLYRHSLQYLGYIAIDL